jgi:flavin-binding protein dodecin
MTDTLDGNAVKIIEIMGVSAIGFDDAVQNAVGKAAESINGITGIEVVKQTASIVEGRIARYEATVKLSFTVR